MINLPSKEARENADVVAGNWSGHRYRIEEHSRKVGDTVWAVNNLAAHLASHYNLRGVRGVVLEIDNDHFEGAYWRPIRVEFGRVPMWVHSSELR